MIGCRFACSHCFAESSRNDFLKVECCIILQVEKRLNGQKWFIVETDKFPFKASRGTPSGGRSWASAGTDPQRLAPPHRQCVRECGPGCGPSVRLIAPTVSPDRVSDLSSGLFTAQKWVKFFLFLVVLMCYTNST